MKSKLDNTGRVTVVGAGPGVSDLMTLRAVKRLLQADVVIYDPAVGDLALEYASANATCIRLGDRRNGTQSAADEIRALVIRHARNGKRVVHLKSGDLAGADPVGSEMSAFRDAGLSVDFVPGVAASASFN